LYATDAERATIEREMRELDVKMDELEHSAKNDPENPFSFYQLSIAYGRLNEIGKAELATAEYYDALGAERDAHEHARRATKLLKAGSPQWIRAQDIYAQTPGPKQAKEE
jgi:predicted Zn-dependent protease